MRFTVSHSEIPKEMLRQPRKALVFPNAMTPADRVHRILDGMITVAASAGIVAAVMFLMTLQ